jgi:hypothetical protein
MCQFVNSFVVNIDHLSASTIVVLFHSAPSAKPGARKGVFTFWIIIPLIGQRLGHVNRGVWTRVEHSNDQL